MPAMLDDPTAPVIYRTSGEPPYPTPLAPLPPDILPRQVTLRDRVTTATLIPFSSPDQVPLSLLSYLCNQLAKEIEKGDTYPMINPLPLESFGPYWFANFGAVMLLGVVQSAEEVRQMARDGRDWEKECLGSFYIKPNYPGRSSHVCNGGFLVTDGARNRGVGRLMGEGYLEWAPKLGYSYSVFNLVYETNVASCRIWDALGFKRIGRVKGCGNLRSYPDQLVDAIIYGRDLGPEGDDYVSEERFDKIRYYLKHGKYPNGADRAEKSRLRSAATHYKLIPAIDDEPEKLMLKGKEVVADPQRQYEVARLIHFEHHGGINKTTASIAEKYHWVRIKETVSMVIRNCPECKDLAKVPPLRAEHSSSKRTSTPLAQTGVGAATRGLGLSNQDSSLSQPHSPTRMPSQEGSTTSAMAHTGEAHLPAHPEPQQQHPVPIADLQQLVDYQVPVDPRIMDGTAQPFDYDHPAQQHLAHYAQSLSTPKYPQPDRGSECFSLSDPSTHMSVFSRQGDDSAYSIHHSLQPHPPRYPAAHQPAQSPNSHQIDATGTHLAVQVAQQAMIVDLHDADEESARTLGQQLINAGYGGQPDQYSGSSDLTNGV